jgi:hypothetical protein
MNALISRVRRLEARFAPPDDPEGRRMAELVHARQRRWAKANSQTYAPPELKDLTGQSIVEILRARFKRPSAE